MKIYVVTHKEIPDKNTNIRQKIKVGGHIDNPDYINDDTGINISEKNPYYCELTALYWIWKNSKEDIVGLEHYRRKFVYNVTPFKYKLLDEKKIKKYLKKNDILILIITKEHRCLYKRYQRGGFSLPSDLGELIALYTEVFPNEDKYLHYYFFKNKKTNYLNTFIGKKEVMDRYCEWLFPLFEKLEKRIIGYQDRDGDPRRLFGYLSEMLFGYWIWKENIKYKQCLILKTDNYFEKNIFRRCAISIRLGLLKIGIPHHNYPKITKFRNKFGEIN